MCSLLHQALGIQWQTRLTQFLPFRELVSALDWISSLEAEPETENQGCVSLGEMCEGVKDAGQIKEGAGKEVGSVGIKPQSDLGEGGTLELDDH